MNKSIEYKATRGLLKYASQRPALPGRRASVSVSPPTPLNGVAALPAALSEPSSAEPVAS